MSTKRQECETQRIGKPFDQNGSAAGDGSHEIKEKNGLPFAEAQNNKPVRGMVSASLRDGLAAQQAGDRHQGGIENRHEQDTSGYGD